MGDAGDGSGDLVVGPNRGEASATVSSLHRFDLAPPRRFLFPAILLLLAEKPGHGYGLEKELAALRFGPTDRPSVYRTLAQLERDGLVVSWSDDATSTQSRRLYRLTTAGAHALRVWMGVVKEERDRLDAVLRRYAGAGGLDAALAEVEGGWGTVRDPSLSAVSPTTESTPRPPSVLRASERGEAPATVAERRQAHFRLVADRCAVLIEARSSVGPLSFGVLELTGEIVTEVGEGRVAAGAQTTATLRISADGLRSGNPIYDAELHRRIDTRRFPVVTLTLRDCVAGGESDRYRVGGEITIHGVTRQLEGTVVVAQPRPGVLTVTGEQVIDIRDFDIALPTVLMLRIYPDVVVRLYLEAQEIDGVIAGSSDDEDRTS